MDVGEGLFGWFFFSSGLGASHSSSMTSLLVPAGHRESPGPTLHCESHAYIQGLDQKLHLRMHVCAKLFHFPDNLLITQPTWGWGWGVQVSMMSLPHHITSSHH